MLKQKEQKQIEKDTIQRKELRYGYLIPSDWNYEKMNQTKSKSESAGHRAWLEIDRKALEHNVCLFQRLLPDTCQLMPAVKAQAYGLGAVLIAKEVCSVTYLSVDTDCRRFFLCKAVESV